jgi:hypothetical protein
MFPKLLSFHVVGEEVLATSATTMNSSVQQHQRPYENLDQLHAQTVFETANINRSTQHRGQDENLEKGFTASVTT